MRVVRQTRSLLPLLLLAACSASEPTGDGGTDAIADARRAFPAALDILIVIDTSSSMVEEQQYLLDCCPQHIRAFERIQHGLPDLRFAMVTADLGAPTGVPTCTSLTGDEAKFLWTGATECPKKPWLSVSTEGASPSCDATPVDCFGRALSKCIGRPGTKGCGLTQPLEAARRALDPALKLNPGFLRPEAALALIIITDEDDCSVTSRSLFDPQTAGLGPLTTFRCFEHGVTCSAGPTDPTAPGIRSGCSPSGTALKAVDNYVSFFKSLKPAGWVIAGVVTGFADEVEVKVGSDGTPFLAPACSSENGLATPAVRLQAFVEAFGDAGFGAPICQGSMYDLALGRLALKYEELRSKK